MLSASGRALLHVVFRASRVISGCLATVLVLLVVFSFLFSPVCPVAVRGGAINACDNVKALNFKV